MNNAEYLASPPERIWLCDDGYDIAWSEEGDPGVGDVEYGPAARIEALEEALRKVSEDPYGPYLPRAVKAEIRTLLSTTKEEDDAG